MRKYITRFDMERLSSLIEGNQDCGGKLRERLEILKKALDRAVVMEPKKMPGNVVTMNSRVHVTRLDSGQESIYELVFPSEADITENKISILAPIGTAILGHSIGTVIEWDVPSGRSRFKINEIVYQPESAGHYNR